jgi:thiamine-monophosphate kinase
MSNLGLGPGREFDRLRGILARLGNAARDIGDDCAVIPDGPGRLVVSVDLAVEEIHFRRDWLTLEEIGWRAASAALSDLAAEGAEVVAVLTGVAVPSAATDEDLYALMAGIGAAAVAAGGVVSGGDLSAGERWVVNLTVIGRARRPVTRGGAMVGDGIWVTGALGGARAALEDWRAGRVPSPLARAAFAHPIPRIAAGVALADAGAHAMLDLSDGLGGDAEHLAAASGVRLEIDLDLLPIHPAVPDVVKAAALPPAMFAAIGGEDYELLVALPPRFRDEDAASFTRAVGLGLTRIGEVRQGSGACFTLAGTPIVIRGYNHFE